MYVLFTNSFLVSSNVLPYDFEFSNLLHDIRISYVTKESLILSVKREVNDVGLIYLIIHLDDRRIILLFSLTRISHFQIETPSYHLYHRTSS